jgi:hypothetical protein
VRYVFILGFLDGTLEDGASLGTDEEGLVICCTRHFAETGTTNCGKLTILLSCEKVPFGRISEFVIHSPH